MPHSHGNDTLHEQLTLRLLLEETPLRNATAVVVDDADLDRPVGWCLPWSVVAHSGDPLEHVLVHADHDLTDEAPAQLPRTVARLARRGATAVAASCKDEKDGPIRDACKRAKLPFLSLPTHVSYHALSRLVAEKNLAN